VAEEAKTKTKYQKPRQRTRPTRKWLEIKIILISWLVRDSQGKSVDSTIGRGPWKTFWLSTLFANELAQSPGFVSPDKGAKSNSSSSPFHFAGILQRIRQVHVSFGETLPFANFYFV